MIPPLNIEAVQIFFESKKQAFLDEKCAPAGIFDTKNIEQPPFMFIDVCIIFLCEEILIMNIQE